MFSEHEPLFSPRPLWFASPELLTQVRRIEIAAMGQLLGANPDLRSLFDAPEATLSQRSVCFELLVHRELVEVIDETFIGRYEASPSLSDIETDTLSRTYKFVTADPPSWVSEMYQVVQRLPVHINAALPEPLRAGGYQHDNPEQMRTIEAAVEALSSVEQVQALTQRVFTEQLQRLVRRWSVAIPSTGSAHQSEITKIKRHPKGFEGLKRKKADYSKYMDGLTEKQQQVFSLRYEYGLTVSEIASRLEIDRSTVYEHIAAVDKKVNQMASSEKRKINRAKLGPGE